MVECTISSCIDSRSRTTAGVSVASWVTSIMAQEYTFLPARAKHADP